ncbi:MAG: aminomethyl-transferring glycine dehydrogenase subunit GcvPB [Candidatus Omnitrophica bacterium]|nr:aminomethyl-transferring glycine dehydrogenase subunit GcvPB [Candidatus Omnitrophota bacterium]
MFKVTAVITALIFSITSVPGPSYIYNDALRDMATGNADGAGSSVERALKSSSQGDPKETVLHDWHVTQGAAMAAFGGWDMPSVYTDAREENLNTRRGVSIFDESHMGLIEITGPDAARFLAHISSPNVDPDGSIREFNDGDVQYRFLFNERGIQIDDIQVVRIAEDHFRLVVNACNTDKVERWLDDNSSGYDCSIRDLRYVPDQTEQRVILAVQGTNGAQDILQLLTPHDLDSIDYFQAAEIDLFIGRVIPRGPGGKPKYTGKVVKCLVQRTGYTGEDGFEIHLHPDDVLLFWESVIKLGARPAALQARDTLRGEAGLPLNGHEWTDDDDGPMPWEYKYAFTVDTSESASYIGAEALRKKRAKSTKALVGIRLSDRQSRLHEGHKVFNDEGKEIGYVTSGFFSPTLDRGIGLVYIDKEFANIGTKLIVRPSPDRMLFAKAVRTPFISHIISSRGRDPRENAPNYIPGGDEERAQKLALVKKRFGADSIEALFGDLQQYFHQGELDLPEPAVNNRALFRLMYGLSLENNTDLLSFRGAGCYAEEPSDLVDYLMTLDGFVTSYTPYQPEVSQGTLRLMFAYQSLMADLLNMDVVNASVYEGANALVEGARMATSITEKDRIVVVGAINPRHKEVLDEYAKNLGINVSYVDPIAETGRVDLRGLKDEIDNETASVIVQQPNFLGIVEEEIDNIADIARENGALLHIHSNDPMQFVFLKTPGNHGADIATAEAQAFVGEHFFGGTNLGIVACKRKHLRYIPGRLAGQTVDQDGNDAFALALARREQFAARKRATSNICTNVALHAARAAVYMLDKGTQGLRSSLIRSGGHAVWFAGQVHDGKIPGFRLFSNAPYAREIVVETTISAKELQQELLKRGIDAGTDVKSYDSFKSRRHLIQFSFTTAHTSTDRKALADALRDISKERSLKDLDESHAQMTGGSRDQFRQDALNIPEIEEPDLRAALKVLSEQNFCVEKHPYPLGSCTMKKTPKVSLKAASERGFARVHPHALPETAQATLQIHHELGEYLKEITGMDAVSLNPSAGAHGELVGITAIFRYFEDKGEAKRNVIITTDSSHGTNPASAAILEAEIVQVKTDMATGRLDMASLRQVLADPKYKGRVAAIMLTEPNTLGVFEDLEEAARLVHEEGGMVYMDGANLNAIAGWIMPADLGVDVMHFNLHKTFSAPHGGGGPGAGPVGVSDRRYKLSEFLPNPEVVLRDGEYALADRAHGTDMGTFLGNTAVSLIAYAYIRRLGPEGLKQAIGDALLNANYLKARLMDEFDMVPATGELAMHEFVISLAKIKKETGCTADDFSKVLENFGIHPPTIYFPLIVLEAMMFEPTESLSIEDLDRIADAMIAIKNLAYANPKVVKGAPYSSPEALRHGLTAALMQTRQSDYKDAKALYAHLQPTPVSRVIMDPVNDLQGVVLKQNNVAAILGISDERLVREAPTAPETPEEELEYRDPAEGWNSDPGQSIPVFFNPKYEEFDDWYRIVEGPDGKRIAVIGILKRSSDLLSIAEIIFEKNVGEEVNRGEVCLEFEGDKADIEFESPVSGKVIARNEAAVEYLGKDKAEQGTDDPYGRGWLFAIELTEEPEPGIDVLTAAAYDEALEKASMPGEVKSGLEIATDTIKYHAFNAARYGPLGSGGRKAASPGTPAPAAVSKAILSGA